MFPTDHVCLSNKPAAAKLVQLVVEKKKNDQFPDLKVQKNVVSLEYTVILGCLCVLFPMDCFHFSIDIGHI
jgi:hypothetical protein